MKIAQFTHSKITFDDSIGLDVLETAKKPIADQSNISIAKLNVSLRLHLRPINQVVFLGSIGRSYLGKGLALRCFQRLSVPCLATRRCHGRDNRNTRGMSFAVLSY